MVSREAAQLPGNGQHCGHMLTSRHVFCGHVWEVPAQAGVMSNYLSFRA